MQTPEYDAKERTVRVSLFKLKRHISGRWLRFMRSIFLILLSIPLILTLLYRVNAIHPVSTLMIADLVTLQGYDRRWISLEDMGTIVPATVMISEDAKFCAHSGVDWDAMKTVINDAFSGTSSRGASTISMQTVKNLYLWNGRSYIRKALELPLSMIADLIWPKKRMMEIYLNIAEWGPGIYGVEAAAQYYFGRPAKNLTRRQAALLAVTLPNPYVRNPAKPSQTLNRLANLIERRAKASGAYISCLK